MQRKPSHALDVNQARALLEVLQSPAREMSMTAMLTSMNVAEICGLSWKYLNLTDSWIVVDGEAIPPCSLLVRQQWRLGEYTSLKETARARTLPIPAALVGVFARMKSRLTYTGPDDASGMERQSMSTTLPTVI
jgi:hypothetical protein